MVYLSLLNTIIIIYDKGVMIMGFNINTSTLSDSMNNIIAKPIDNLSIEEQLIVFNAESDRLITEFQCANYNRILQIGMNESKIELINEGFFEKAFDTIVKILQKIKGILLGIIDKIASLRTKVYRERIKKLSEKKFEIEVPILISNKNELDKFGKDIEKTFYGIIEENINKIKTCISNKTDYHYEAIKMRSDIKNAFLNFGCMNKSWILLHFDQNSKDKKKITEYGDKTWFGYENTKITNVNVNEIGGTLLDMIDGLTLVARSNLKYVSNNINRIVNINTDFKNKKDGLSNNTQHEIQGFCTDISHYSNFLAQVFSNLVKICISQVNQIIKKVEGSISEGTIHGEEFDSDILFANGDLDDFNSMEWADLALRQGDADYDILTNNIQREAYLLECQMYLSEEGPSMERLRYINEIADTKQVGAVMNAIFDKMGEIIKEFFKKIDEKINVDRPYVQKYKDTILKDNPPEMYPMKTGGWIVLGEKHIRDFVNNNYINKFQFNYTDNNGDTFKSKENYFASIVKNFDNTGEMGNYDPNTPYIDWLKKYFGAPFTDTKDNITIDGQKTKIDMNIVYNYLVDAKTLKTGIQRMHDTVKRFANAKDMQYMKQNKETPATNNNQGNQNNQGSGQNNSGDSGSDSNTVTANKNGKQNVSASAVYSFVQGKYLTEIDMPKQTINPDAQITEKNDSYINAKKIYVQVMNDIIKAMMTGAEYIRGEYRAMVKWKINYYHPSNGQVRKRNNG